MSSVAVVVAVAVARVPQTWPGAVAVAPQSDCMVLAPSLLRPVSH
jgi:hypothetical protein